MHPRQLAKRKEAAEDAIAQKVLSMAESAGIEAPQELENPGGRNRDQRSMNRLEAAAAALEAMPEPKKSSQKSGSKKQTEDKQGEEKE